MDNSWLAKKNSCNPPTHQRLNLIAYWRRREELVFCSLSSAICFLNLVKVCWLIFSP